MKRILILLAATLLLHGFDAHGEVVSEKRWKQYEAWAKAIYPEQDVALAVAPNGSNCSNYGRSQAQAKANALWCCKTSQGNPSNANCKIVDVNFKSKNKWSSTIFVPKTVWCANSKSVFLAVPKSCNSRTDGKGFSTKAQAEAEHQRLKKKITTASTSGSNSVRWCADKYRFWRLSSWQEGCGSSSVKVFSTRYQAEAEYKRLMRIAIASSSSKVWCASPYSAFQTFEYYCNSNNWESFSTKAQAQVEHQRLKKQTTASTSGSKSVRWCANIYSFWSLSSWQEGCGSSSASLFSTRYQAEAEHQRLKKKITTASTSGSNSALTTGWCSEPKISGGRLYQRIATKCEGKIFATYDEAAAEYNRVHTIVYPEIGPYDTIWCANKLTVAEYKKWNCDEINGTAHRSKSLAQGEHQRLKNQTSTASSNQAPQQTTARTDSAEIVFWQSIKDSNDPDMFRAYLTKYPEGEFVLLAKINIKNLNDTTVAEVAIPNLEYGNYYALVIGNNRYRNFSDLKTPINDARSVARVLKSSYGFKVNVLENATESEIFKAIVNLRSTVGRNDNVLIYYGGHGDLDNVTDEGFWIPSDAKEDDPSTYLAVDRIRKQIKAMPAKHVMVVADSCFAGSLTRATLTRALKVKPRSPEYHSELQRISNKKSRTALVSGGLEPVMDSGSDGHSVFAGAFISALEGNDGVLDAHMLFIQVREHVRNNSPQNPEYRPIYETGHDGGDFLFVRQ
jgi:uncharacterized caspase-like protein